MKTWLRLVLVLLVGSSSAASAAQPGVRYRGKVVDASGQPVSEAAVEIHRYPSGPVAVGTGDLEVSQHTTGTNGLFEVRLERGLAYVVVRKPGLATTWRQVNVTGDLEQTITLTPPSFIGGMVVDGSDQPMADAEVFPVYLLAIENVPNRSYFYFSGKAARAAFSARSGPDGRFRVENFPTNGMAILAAEKPGWTTRGSELRTIGPETMQCRAGQKDVKVLIERAGAVEGRVLVEETGQPLAGVTMNAQPVGGGLRFGSVKPATSDAEGRFRLEGLAAGSWRVQTVMPTNRVADLVAEWVNISVESGQTTRDLKVLAGPGGFLEVRVLNPEDRGLVPEAAVNAFAETYQAGGTTGSNGVALLRLPAGRYRVMARKENWRQPVRAEEAAVEKGRTNRVEVALQPPARITGTVRDPSGAPVTNLTLRLFPEYRVNVGPVVTDAAGRFEFVWNPQRVGSLSEKICLLAVDTNRMLAAAVDLEEDTRTLDLRLEPSLTITGKVEDEKSQPVSNATVSVSLWAGNAGFSFGQPPRTGADGKFSLAGLPPGRRYSVSVNARGFGSASSSIREPEEGVRTIELETFTLRLADRPLAGQVLDAEEKPVSGAQVFIYGQGQPNASARTDARGFFKFEAVCEGTVRLSARYDSQYGSMSAEGGDTNVVLVLGRQAAFRSDTPPRGSLVGRPLPDLTSFGLDAQAVPKGRPALICLFDCEQRPSRRCLSLLAGQQEELRRKGISVAAIQATVVDGGTLKTWKESGGVSFPVGQVREKSDQVRWVTTHDTLPWLILVDRKGQVAAEGFSVEELGAKVQSLGQ